MVKDDNTPHDGSITLERRLEMIDNKLERIQTTLVDGTSRMDGHGWRLIALEAIVYGSCAIAGGAVVLKGIGKLIVGGA